jgi:hypothetical protein
VPALCEIALRDERRRDLHVPLLHDELTVDEESAAVVMRERELVGAGAEVIRARPTHGEVVRRNA